MAGRPPIEFTVDQREIQRVAKALKEQADGKDLRKFLIRDMRAAAGPTVVDLQAAISSSPARVSASPGLRPAIARGIRPAVRLNGASTGVSIRAGTTPGVRGFRQAARLFNRPSFRHPVFGGPGWADQVGRPNWFDDTTAAHRDEIHRSAMAAVQSMADLLAARARS